MARRIPAPFPDQRDTDDWWRFVLATNRSIYDPWWRTVAADQAWAEWRRRREGSDDEGDGLAHEG
jgi:hypothetical protein